MRNVQRENSAQNLQRETHGVKCTAQNGKNVQNRPEGGGGVNCKNIAQQWNHERILILQIHVLQVSAYTQGQWMRDGESGSWILKGTGTRDFSIFQLVQLIIPDGFFGFK